MREIRRDPSYLDDPLLLEYVQGIWTPLVGESRARGRHHARHRFASFAWEAFLVRDRSVNAFALPGGCVGVHLGLIAITGSRDELRLGAGARAQPRHAAPHRARHRQQQRQSMIGLAALLIGMIAASRPTTDMANAAIVGSQAGMIQGQLNFSRDMEREADRIGFQLLAGAGFSPPAWRRCSRSSTRPRA